MSDTGAPRPKLLVVEDDPGLQTQLKWAYEDYAVLVAGDHDSAIDLLRAEEPAVVTLDLGLPPDPDGTREGFRRPRAHAADANDANARGAEFLQSALSVKPRDAAKPCFKITH